MLETNADNLVSLTVIIVRDRSMTLVAASFRKVFFPPFMILDMVDLVFNFVERNACNFLKFICSMKMFPTKRAPKCTNLLPNWLLNEYFAYKSILTIEFIFIYVQRVSWIMIFIYDSINNFVLLNRNTGEKIENWRIECFLGASSFKITILMSMSSIIAFQYF